MQINRLLRNKEIKHISLYDKNKAEAIQGTEGLEAEEGTEQAEAVWIYKQQKFVETYIHKKEKRRKRLKGGKRNGGKEEKRKDKDVFLLTTDLEIRRRRRLMRDSQGEDSLASQTQFYFQDQENAQGRNGVTSNSTS